MEVGVAFVEYVICRFRCGLEIHYSGQRPPGIALRADPETSSDLRLSPRKILEARLNGALKEQTRGRITQLLKSTDQEMLYVTADLTKDNLYEYVVEISLEQKEPLNGEEISPNPDSQATCDKSSYGHGKKRRLHDGGG